jgi:hypothetical protein
MPSTSTQTFLLYQRIFWTVKINECSRFPREGERASLKRKRLGKPLGFDEDIPDHLSGFSKWGLGFAVQANDNAPGITQR